MIVKPICFKVKESRKYRNKVLPAQYVIIDKKNIKGIRSWYDEVRINLDEPIESEHGNTDVIHVLNSIEEVLNMLKEKE